MNTLIVGAGAVGKVVAYHLERGGQTVALLSRRHTDVSPAERRLYPLGLLGRRRPVARLTAAFWDRPIADLASHRWDQVYLCLPSDALRHGLIEAVAAAVGDATVIKLQPGPADREALLAFLRPSRLVTGMVSFVAFPTPLPGEPDDEPGTTFWFPPLLASPFSGPAERRDQVVAAFRRGGLPARRHRNVEGLVEAVVAWMAPITAGLECAGGSLAAFQQSHWPKVAARAVRQATASLGGRLAGSGRLASPGGLGLALRLGARLAPFPLEPYLAAHYRRLRPQSLAHLTDFIERGRAAGVVVDSLEELRAGLAGLPTSTGRGTMEARVGRSSASEV